VDAKRPRAKIMTFITSPPSAVPGSAAMRGRCLSSDDVLFTWNVRFGSLAHHIDGGIGLFSGPFPETHVPIETRP